MGHYFTNQELPSQMRDVNAIIGRNKIVFKTDNGVFSKKGIDFGTRLLIESIKDRVNGTGLDFGCGYGVIGICLSKLSNVKMDMIDVNKRAIHLAKMNIENNKVTANAFVSNGFYEVERKYDFIVSNPPIRIGKESLYKIILDAKNYLIDEGVIYLVIRKDQGANSFIKDMDKNYKISILEKNKGFFIIMLSFC